MSRRRIGTAALLSCALLVHPFEVVGQTETEANTVHGPARQGEVTANDVYVRSGPSLNHYSVLKLHAGDRVTVVGDAPEWYQIVPPEAAFSLVSGEFVDAASDGTHGVVNGDRVRVRAGSQLNDNKYTVQTMLDKGAEVTILGRNPDGFLRIRPPGGTTLWISRSLVALASDGHHAPQPNAPQPDSIADANESSAAEAPSSTLGSMNANSARPEASGGDGSSKGQPAPSAFAGTSPTPARQELDAIDADARREMAKPMAERRLEPLLQRYAAVATDKSDELARRYAEERSRQLRDVQSIIETVQQMRRLSEKTDAERREFLQERASIPTVAPAAPSGLDAEGTLRESALYPADRVPRRCRLVDETKFTPRTVAYVDFPAGFAQSLDNFMGRRVGLRAVSKTWQAGSVEPVPVYAASELVLIGESAPVPAADSATDAGVDAAGNEQDN